MTGPAQVTAYGVLDGGLLAVLAVGLSLTLRMTGIINVAYGEFVLIGAYLTWWLDGHLAADPFLGVPIAMAVLFLLGYLLQRLVLNRFVDAPLLLSLLLMFGLSALLQSVIVTLHPNGPQALVTPYALAGPSIAGVDVPLGRLLAFAFCIVCACAVSAFLNRTRLGLVVRAVGMNRRAARLAGIDVRHVHALTFGIGTALAGAGGAMVALVGSFGPGDSEVYTMVSFAVAVLGGLRGVRGALAAGIVVGVAQAWAAYFFSAVIVYAVVFALAVGVLLVDPRGLFAARDPVAGGAR